jgi:hypothetical protein
MFTNPLFVTLSSWPHLHLSNFVTLSRLVDFPALLVIIELHLSYPIVKDWRTLPRR